MVVVTCLSGHQSTVVWAKRSGPRTRLMYAWPCAENGWWGQLVGGPSDRPIAVMRRAARPAQAGAGIEHRPVSLDARPARGWPEDNPGARRRYSSATAGADEAAEIDVSAAHQKRRAGHDSDRTRVAPHLQSFPTVLVGNVIHPSGFPLCHKAVRITARGNGRCTRAADMAL